MKELMPPISPDAVPDAPEIYLRDPNDSANPAAAETYTTPADDFMAHVEAVRKHGDAIDAIPAYGQRRQLGVQTFILPAGVTAMTWEASVALGSASPVVGGLLAPLAVTGLAGVIGVAGAEYKYRKSDKRLSQRLLGEDVRERVHEEYDLFRMPAGKDELTGEPLYEVHMRYYMPTATRTHTDGKRYNTADYVKNMATLAEKAGVAKVMISVPMANEVTDITPADSNSMRNILEEAKPLRFKKGTMNELVVAMTPREWQETESPLRKRDNENEIAGLVGALRQIRCEHPIVRAYDQSLLKVKGPLANGKKELHKAQRAALEKVVDTAIERDFSETSSDSKQVQMWSEDGVRRPHYWEARIVGRRSAQAWSEFKADQEETQGQPRRQYTVDWSYKGATTNSRPLESVLGLTGRYTEGTEEAEWKEGADEKGWSKKDEPELLLKHPEGNPSQAQKLIIALLKQRLDPEATKDDLKDLPRAPKIEDVTAKAGLVTDSNSVTRRLLFDYNIPLRHNPRVIKGPAGKSTLRKGIAGAVLLGVLGAGAYFGLEKVDNNYHNELWAAKEHVAKEVAEQYDLDPSKLNWDDPALKERVRQYAEEHTLSGISSTWEAILEGQLWLNERLDIKPNKKPGAGQQAGSRARTYGVGNVERDGLPKTEWALEAQGMSTEGYWASATSTVLEISEDGALRWQAAESIMGPRINQPLPADYKGEQYIRVTRTVGMGDTLSANAGYIKVPVKEGTRVVAANLDGKPLALYVRGDNTSALQGSHFSEGGQLTYWIVPDVDAPLVRIEGSPRISPSSSGFDVTSVPYVWNDVIPHFSDKSPAEKRQLMLDYILKNFEYSLTPIPEGQQLSPEPKGYTEDMLESERAICNTAATGMAIGTMHFINPDDRVPNPNALGVAIGHRNNSDNELTNYELHMWNVSNSGESFDATPTKHEPAKAEVAAVEPASNVPFKIGVAALAAVALLGSAAYAARRPIKRARHERAAKKVEAFEAKTEELRSSLLANPEALHKTAEVVNALRYDPARNVVGALRRAGAGGVFAAGRSAQTGLEKVLRLVYDDELAGANTTKKPKRPHTEELLTLNTAQRKTEDPEVMAALKDARRVLADARKLYKRTGTEQS